MSLGQSMITVLFFALLTLMFLNAVQLMNKADRELMTVNAYKTAADLAQSMMTEILTKRFDHKVSSAVPPWSSSASTIFTAPGSLGPEAGESFTMPDSSQYPLPFKSIAKFNDVDDYNRYSRITDTTNGLSPFRDSVIVYYVSWTDPPSYSGSATFYKKIEVWVTQADYLSDFNPTTGIRTYKWIKLYRIVAFNTW
jgi:hypothetical protein